MNELNKFWIYILVFIGLVIQCQSESEWVFYKEIPLENISPIGIVVMDSSMWISDAPNNRVVKLNLAGVLIKEYSGFQRPMHLSESNKIIYVPEYLTDRIKMIHVDSVEYLSVHAALDAPSALDVKDHMIAIADFYNHRIVLQENGKITLLGKKGNGKGELYYPTDVAIANDQIYVGDAYNNRVQVFDKQGHSVQIIGEQDSIQVATGIYLTEDQIFITDFYGNRVLIYDLNGSLVGELSDFLNGPTDITIENNYLYISNYHSRSIAVYDLVK